MKRYTDPEWELYRSDKGDDFLNSYWYEIDEGVLVFAESEDEALRGEVHRYQFAEVQKAYGALVLVIGDH